MHSPVFREFKKEMGQSNQFLITILVGLDAVDDGAQKRESFNVSWNPMNITASVVRSRHFAIKAALAWAVDNLDMYLRLCNRVPRLYSIDESKHIAKTGHSVYSKFKYIIGQYAELDICLNAYVDLLICWRNNMVHFDAENQLLPESKRYFNNIAADDIVVNKYHLDAMDMLNHFGKNECPTFKEVATLIAMTIRFVELLDTCLLKKLDQYKYLQRLLYTKIKENNAHASVFSNRNISPEKKKKRFKQLFATAGIDDTFYDNKGESFFEDIIKLGETDFLTNIRQEIIEEELLMNTQCNVD